MRTIGIMTDVHANLPALDAALTLLAELGVQEIVHTGDAIGIGPFPAETLSRLLAVPGIRFVMGNHDALFAHGLPDPRPAWMDAGEAAHQTWVHAQLDPSLREVVVAWPWAIEETIHGVRVRWQHYALADAGDGFASIVPEPDADQLDALFGATSTDVVCFGHHHPPMDRVGTSGVRYVNPGALGASRDDRARVAVLTVADDGAWSIAHHAAAYDAAPVLAALEERAVPERELIRSAFYGR